MGNYSNYPPGTEHDPRAPWNQVDESDVCISCDDPEQPIFKKGLCADCYDIWHDEIKEDCACYPSPTHYINECGWI